MKPRPLAAHVLLGVRSRCFVASWRGCCHRGIVRGASPSGRGEASATNSIWFSCAASGRPCLPLGGTFAHGFRQRAELHETGRQKADKRNRRQWKRTSVSLNPLDQKAKLKALRESWANTCNTRLPETARIDHRSLEAAYLPHAPASAHGQVPLHQGTQPQSVQAEQHPSVERAKLNVKPHGILHFFFHTTNETARPLHTKIGRAG